MDQERAKTYEALSAFIESQKALLSTTHADIERLKRLREDALSKPVEFASQLGQKLDESSFKLSEQIKNAAVPLEDIDWSVYATCDPTPLQTLAANARRVYDERNRPHTNQRSELSDLQKLVKKARQTCVDPVLQSLPPLSSDSEDSASEMDPQELKKVKERERIRALKKNKIVCGLTLPSQVQNGSSGVHVRVDQDDETAEVDISFEDGHKRPSETPMDVDIALNGGSSVLPTPALEPATWDSAPRLRRPSAKAKLQRDMPGTKKASVKKKATPVATEPVRPATTESLKSGSGSTGKARPETYKQAWSVEEQHLLERLLEEIPDGEKNRWQKISKRMNGKRTPRQVASRVQKYFEKLKRFGLDMDVATNTG